MAKRKQPTISEDISERLDAVVATAAAATGDRLRETLDAWLGRPSDQEWDASNNLAYVRLKKDGEETTARYPPDFQTQLFAGNYDMPLKVKLTDGEYQIVGLNGKEGAIYFEGFTAPNALPNLPIAMTQSRNGFNTAAVTDPARLVAPVAQRQYAQTVAVDTTGFGGTLTTSGEGALTLDASSLQVGDVIELEMIGSYISNTPGNAVTVTTQFSTLLGSFGQSLNAIPTSTVSQSYRLTCRVYILASNTAKALTEGVFPPATPVMQLSTVDSFSLDPSYDITIDVSSAFLFAGTNRLTADVIMIKVLR